MLSFFLLFFIQSRFCDQVVTSEKMCPPSDLATTSQTHESHLDIDSIVPQTSLSQAAYEQAASVLHPAILNHSIRVYLYAKALAEQTSSSYSSDASKHDLLFTACLFHDIGTTPDYNSSQRFEVEGGDAAVAHLSQFDTSEADRHDVWTAIAIHTSPGIAERIGELSRIVRIAVITDFGRKSQEWDRLAPLREKLEVSFQRGSIEKVLGDAVAMQAIEKPEKAPAASWPGVLYRAAIAEPDWIGVNKAF